MEAAWRVWETDGCFAAHGQADAIRAVRDELIRGRSSEQVRHMEIERGFAQ